MIAYYIYVLFGISDRLWNDRLNLCYFTCNGRFHLCQACSAHLMTSRLRVPDPVDQHTLARKVISFNKKVFLKNCGHGMNVICQNILNVYTPCRSMMSGGMVLREIIGKVI